MGTNAKEGSDTFNMQIETKAVYASINVRCVCVGMMNARRQKKIKFKPKGYNNIFAVSSVWRLKKREN